MPDIPDRLTRESELTRDLNTEFNRQRRVVQAANGDNVPWTTFQEGIEAALITHLSATFEIARTLFLEQAATGIVLAALLLLLGRVISGAQWARSVASGLAASIVAKSQESVTQAKLFAADAANSEATTAAAAKARDRAFRDSIKVTFSVDRVESISATETTRAISAGEASGARVIEQQDDSILSPQWVTEADARVCPICQPLHLKHRPEWVDRFPDGPPAHPRCRCWLVWRDNNGKSIGTVTGQ